MEGWPWGTNPFTPSVWDLRWASSLLLQISQPAACLCINLGPCFSLCPWNKFPGGEGYVRADWQTLPQTDNIGFVPIAPCFKSKHLTFPILLIGDSWHLSSLHLLARLSFCILAIIVNALVNLEY